MKESDFEICLNKKLQRETWKKKKHIIYLKSQIFLFDKDIDKASKKKRSTCDFK